MVLKIFMYSNFWIKNAFGSDLKPGMDATTSDGSFATILSNGSAGMPQKLIDFDLFL